MFLALQHTLQLEYLSRYSRGPSLRGNLLTSLLVATPILIKYVVDRLYIFNNYDFWPFYTLTGLLPCGPIAKGCSYTINKFSCRESFNVYSTLYWRWTISFTWCLNELPCYPTPPRGGLFLVSWFPVPFRGEIVANRVTPSYRASIAFTSSEDHRQSCCHCYLV